MINDNDNMINDKSLCDEYKGTGEKSNVFD